MRSDPWMMGVAAALFVSACAGKGADGAPGTAAPAARTPTAAEATVAGFAAKGEPRRCLQLRDTQLIPASEFHLMAREGANRWYRNDLRGRCVGLSRQNIVVLRAMTNQMCELDVFDVVDPVAQINFGMCSLGSFTPVDVPKGARW